MGRAKSMRDVQKESSKIFSQNLHSTNEITLNQSIRCNSYQKEDTKRDKQKQLRIKYKCEFKYPYLVAKTRFHVLYQNQYIHIYIPT